MKKSEKILCILREAWIWAFSNLDTKNKPIELKEFQEHMFNKKIMMPKETQEYLKILFNTGMFITVSKRDKYQYIFNIS